MTAHTTRTPKYLATLVAILGLALSACAGGADEGDGADAAETNDTAATDDAAAGTEGDADSTADLEGQTVAFIPGVNDPFYISMQCAIEEAAAEVGMSVDAQIPEAFEPGQQIPIVNGVASAAPAGMLIAPTDAEALISPLRNAAESGIPVGLVDTTLSDSSFTFTSVATDNIEGGRQAADALAELIGEEGKVLVIAFSAGASTSDQRQQGFEEGIAEYDSIEYLGAEINNNDPAQAASIVSATLSAHPDLAGIFATNLFAAEGAATGLRNAGQEGDVKIVGFDAGPGQVEQLERGDVQALVAQRPAEIGHRAFEQLIAELTGREPESQIETSVAVITQDNLEDPESQEVLYKTSC